MIPTLSEEKPLPHCVVNVGTRGGGGPFAEGACERNIDICKRVFLSDGAKKMVVGNGLNGQTGAQ